MPFDFLPSLDRECDRDPGPSILERAVRDQRQGRPRCRQDARQHDLPRLDRHPVSACENHSLPARPPRRGPIVLDDRLSRSALGVRPRPDRPANPRARAVDGTLAPGAADPMLEVDYEELVADLETGRGRLVAWCGLDWDPACLEFHKNKRPVQTSSVRAGPPADLRQLGRPLEELRRIRSRHYSRSSKAFPECLCTILGGRSSW